MTVGRRRRRSTPTALARIGELIRELRPEADETRRRYVEELAYTAIRLLDDGTSIADVKLLNAAMRELRYALAMFAAHRERRKISIFGSARTRRDAPEYAVAKEFAAKVADAGFWVITGGGDGIMRACQEGAGRERSFGLNIRLPFEQKANDIIAGDPKLVTFRYFFTRKLLFVKEANAVVMFPGGFGTHDEAFEVLTLIQTGKAPIVPILFIDAPGRPFWQQGLQYIRDRLLAGGLISEEDLNLFRATDDVDDAVAEISRFYRVYHSARYVGDELILRLQREPSEDVLQRLSTEFADIILRGTLRMSGPLPEEIDAIHPELPRLVFHFNRINYGRLRKLINAVNEIP
jgi:uncharacterized protein (TIGR00730 family)